VIEAGLPALLESVAPAHPLFKPDSTGYPVISYRLLSRIEDETHDGACGLVAYHYQLTCHETTNTLCGAMRNAIIALMRNVHDVYVGGVLIERVQITASHHIGYFLELGAWQESVDATFHAKE